MLTIYFVHVWSNFDNYAHKRHKKAMAFKYIFLRLCIFSAYYLLPIKKKKVSNHSTVSRVRRPCPKCAVSWATAHRRSVFAPKCAAHKYKSNTFSTGSILLEIIAILTGYLLTGAVSFLATLLHARSVFEQLADCCCFGLANWTIIIGG